MSEGTLVLLGAGAEYFLTTVAMKEFPSRGPSWSGASLLYTVAERLWAGSTSSLVTSIHCGGLSLSRLESDGTSWMLVGAGTGLGRTSS